MRLASLCVESPEFSVGAIKLGGKGSSPRILKSGLGKNVGQSLKVVCKAMLAALAEVVVDVLHFRRAPGRVPNLLRQIEVPVATQPGVFRYRPFGIGNAHAENAARLHRAVALFQERKRWFRVIDMLKEVLGIDQRARAVWKGKRLAQIEGEIGMTGEVDVHPSSFLVGAAADVKAQVRAAKATGFVKANAVLDENLRLVPQAAKGATHTGEHGANLTPMSNGNDLEVSTNAVPKKPGIKPDGYPCWLNH